MEKLNLQNVFNLVTKTIFEEIKNGDITKDNINDRITEKTTEIISGFQKEDLEKSIIDFFINSSLSL